MPRELSQCRKWEKDRRLRLNECFSNLGKLLPCYDPSSTLSKIDILTKAASYVEELRGKVSTCLTEDNENRPERAEIKQLYKRVKHLLTRNEQLTNLLKDAGISIPSEYGPSRISKAKKWSQKITPEKAEALAKIESQKENEPKKIKKTIIKEKKPNKARGVIKAKLKRVNKGKTKVVKVSTELAITNTPTPVVTIANVQPCYFIANTVQSNLSGSKANAVSVTNSNIFTTPILSTAVKASTLGTKQNTFPNGTFIIANSLPVVQPPTLINPPILLPPSNTLIVVKNNKTNPTTVLSTKSTSSISKSINAITKTFTAICPKRRSITKTTHINKLPIPASRYASNYILVSNVAPRFAPTNLQQNQYIVKKKRVVKKRKIANEKVSNEKAKKIKTADEGVKDSQESKKSDYSIDAICKEKDVVDVVDDEDNKKNDADKNKEEVKAVEKNDKIEEQPLLIEEETVEVIEEVKVPEEKAVEITPEITDLGHSELSNDIFASLQVPSGSQNPESTSPTAAFLNAFPLVSSFTGVKVTEVIEEEETSDSPQGTPTLLQIGTMDSTKPTQTPTDSLTPSLLNLDNFSFFSSKDILYSSFDTMHTNSTSNAISRSKDMNVMTKTAKILYDNAISDTENLKSPKVALPNNFDKAKLDRKIVITSTNTFYPINQVQSSTAYSIANISNNLPQNNVVSKSNFAHYPNVAQTLNPNRIKTSLESSNAILPLNNNSSVPINTSTPLLSHHVNKPQPPVINTNLVPNTIQRNLIHESHNNTLITQPVSNTSNTVSYVNPILPQTRINTSIRNDANVPTFNTGLAEMNVVPDILPPNVSNTPTNTTTSVNYPVLNKKPVDKDSCSRYPSYNIPEYNTFNPFTDLPKSTTVCTYITTKTYNQSVYSNNTNCNYNYQSDFNTNYKNLGKNYMNTYDSYDNANQYNYYNQMKPGNKTKNEPRAPVNWMTTPDLKQQPNNDFVVPEFTTNIYTQNSFITNQTTYFNTTAPIYSSTEFNTNNADGKKLDTQFNNTFQREEEHQFAWSPTKIPQLIEPPHSFVSNPLPTLVGDLALGNTYLDKNKKIKERKSAQQNYDSTSNFLSVSQLVDHNKTESVGRITARRNSGGRTKAASKTKRNNKEKDTTSPKNQIKMQNYPEPDWMDKRAKIPPPSSYSAEALIGSQTGIMNIKRQQQQNYSKPLPFLSDNLIPYFPPVDIPTDNNFNQQNQNYQANFSHTFPSSMPNNTFVPNSTTTYLPASNFISEIGEYNPMISDNIFSHNNQKGGENRQFLNKNQPKPPPVKQTVTTPKKSNKKKPTNESTSFVDFSFLSMPSAINSPILPDDFHTHSNFLPPPPNPNQLYACKNPLYPKQSTELTTGLLPIPPVTRGNIQHPEVSPMGNVGTSLTNFNLSTIFPEINKSSVPEMYLDTSKNKDYGLQRSYLQTSSQIPFTKASIYNTITESVIYK